MLKVVALFFFGALASVNGRADGGGVKFFGQPVKELAAFGADESVAQRGDGRRAKLLELLFNSRLVGRVVQDVVELAEHILANRANVNFWFGHFEFLVGAAAANDGVADGVVLARGVFRFNLADEVIDDLRSKLFDEIGAFRLVGRLLSASTAHGWMDR